MSYKNVPLKKLSNKNLTYKSLIEQMSLEEKASLLSGKDFWQTQDISRLDIPSIFLADGPHGIRRQAEAADHLGLNASIPATCFPTAATVANSWDTELGEKIGKFLGIEASIQNVQVLLGPGLNIKRNPLCGRNFEYFSEDPILAGKMAASYVRGIQDSGVAACVKHFAANNQETLRMTTNVVLDERSLREIYLTGFEIAVKEGDVKVVMSAYNRINGHYANEHPYLLQDILRKEWGFSGCIVSDWGGSNDRVAGLKAGNELEMPGTDGESDRQIVEAVKAGALEEKVVDENVERLLQMIFSTNKAREDVSDSFDIQRHHTVAREAAEESIVLLKNNEGILPLDSEKTVAVIGDFAQAPRYQGAGSSNVNPTILNSTLDVLEDYGIRSIGFEPGFKRYGQKSTRLLKKACKLAREADTVLLYLGLDEVTEAEGLDRSNMSLPENQILLLKALSEVNPRIIIILSAGSAIEMPWLDQAQAIVHGYLGGQAGAEAMLGVLSGRVNPSGKLAESYPHQYTDVPSAKNFPGGEASVEYREGLFVGYRYFLRESDKLLFPFGFGLSYTDFHYSNLQLSSDSAQFDITNSGTIAGKEIAQLYINKSSEHVFRPERELKGFTKVNLDPGETKHVSIPLDEMSFRFFNTKENDWDTEAGEYEILIGASSLDIRLHGKLEIKGSNVSRLYNKEKIPSYFSGDVQNLSRKEFKQLLQGPVPPSDWNREQALAYNDALAQCQYARGAFGRFVYRMLVFFRWLLWKLGKRDMANLIMMSFYNMPFRGMAKMLGGMVNFPMVDGFLMIANGHFFKGLAKVIKENRKMRMYKRKNNG